MSIVFSEDERSAHHKPSTTLQSAPMQPAARLTTPAGQAIATQAAGAAKALPAAQNYEVPAATKHQPMGKRRVPEASSHAAAALQHAGSSDASLDELLRSASDLLSSMESGSIEFDDAPAEATPAAAAHPAGPKGTANGHAGAGAGASKVSVAAAQLPNSGVSAPPALAANAAAAGARMRRAASTNLMLSDGEGSTPSISGRCFSDVRQAWV